MPLRRRAMAPLWRRTMAPPTPRVTRRQHAHPRAPPPSATPRSRVRQARAPACSPARVSRSAAGHSLHRDPGIAHRPCTSNVTCGPNSSASGGSSQPARAAANRDPARATDSAAPHAHAQQTRRAAARQGGRRLVKPNPRCGRASSFALIARQSHHGGGALHSTRRRSTQHAAAAASSRRCGDRGGRARVRGRAHGGGRGAVPRGSRGRGRGGPGSRGSSTPRRRLRQRHRPGPRAESIHTRLPGGEQTAREPGTPMCYRRWGLR